MTNKKIIFNLSSQSLKQAVLSIEAYKNLLIQVNAEFIRLSIEWLKIRASENIMRNYPDFASDFTSIITGNLGILQTTDEKMTYIEFGTGIVGANAPHELAEESNYQYDVNSHGEKGWTFTYFMDTKLDVKESDIISRKAGNHSNMWEQIKTRGAEPERFMFNAFVDFYNKGKYKEIYRQAYDKYMKV